MIDPITAIGAAAALEQLGEATAAVFYNLYKYYDAIENAPRCSQELQNELSVMRDQLSLLTDELLNKSETGLTSISPSLPEAINEFKTLLAEMSVRTRPSQTTGVKRLKWPFTRIENEKILSE